MLLEMKNITKSFPGVLALDNVDFDLDESEVQKMEPVKAHLLKYWQGYIELITEVFFLKGKQLISILLKMHRNWE